MSEMTIKTPADEPPAAPLAPLAPAAPLAPEGPPANALVSVGRFFFKWRNATFPLIFLAAALLARPVLFGGTLRSDLWLDAAGIGLCALGQVVRGVTVGLDYIKRGGKKKKVYADRLVTGGVFQHCRNPLYVGNLLQIAGLCVVHNSLWMYALVLPFFVFIYVCIVAAEEQFLRHKFGGEYAEYCRRVSRWWVSPAGWGRTLRGANFDWKKLFRKEYGTPFGVATAALLLMAWESVHNNAGVEAGGTRLAVLGLAWLPLLGLYVLTRVMKKRGALGQD